MSSMNNFVEQYLQHTPYLAVNSPLSTAETNCASICILCRRPVDETSMCIHCQQQLQGGLWSLCLCSCLSQTHTCNLSPLYSKYVYTSSKLVYVIYIVKQPALIRQAPATTRLSHVQLNRFVYVLCVISVYLSQ